MAVAETVLKEIFTIIGQDDEVNITVDSRGLGMSYAIPKGSADTVVDDYSPWSSASVKQVFYRQSALGSTMAEAQLVLSWQYSAAQQYIINANLDKAHLILDPTVSLKINIRFNHPELYDVELEAYRINFTVQVTFDPALGLETVLSSGYIQANGVGEFPPFPSPAA